MKDEPDLEKLAHELIKLANGVKYLSIAFSVVTFAILALIAVVTLPPIIWAWLVEHTKWLITMAMFVSAVIVHAVQQWDGK
jgi:hypothetical protein